MSDATGASAADDAETPNSSDYEGLHDYKLKETISKFLENDSDRNSSYGSPPKKKNYRLLNETTKDVGSQSERTETEISADDVRDVVSEESRGSEFSQGYDERRRRFAERLNTRSESDSDGVCSDVSTKNRSKKSEKNIKLCKKSSYSKNKSCHDDSKLLHSEKSPTSGKKSCHSGQLLGSNSSKKSHDDRSRWKKHQHTLSNHNDRKFVTNVGRQLSGSEKSVREKVKAGVQDRRTPSGSKGTKSRAVDVRDMSSEDSRTSELSDNSASNSSCQGGGAETLSFASRSNSVGRSSPCESISSHDLNKLQRKDHKTSSNSKCKSRLDDVMSCHTNKSHASINRSRHDDKSHNHDKKSHHSKSKSREGRLDFNEKKLHHGDVASRGSNGKQLSGCEKSIKKEELRTKTSHNEGKTGAKARSATCKTAEADNSTDDFSELLSENSRTSDLWAGFALGDWGHGRATDRHSIASKSDLDEVSSHCGSAASRGKLPTKKPKKSSDVEAKLRHGDKKSHRSDKSPESDKKSWQNDKLHITDKRSHYSSNDKSQLGGKSLNSSSKQSVGTKRQAVKDESVLNTGSLQKSSRGLSFFSGSKKAPYVTHSSTYKAPNVKVTSKLDAPTHLDDSPPVFTKVKINGISVFIDKTLRTDPKLWQLVDVALVNCDHVMVASLAKQRDETLAQKTGGNFSSVNTSSRNREEQKTLHKRERENENDASKILVNKHSHSNDSRQKKSFETLPEDNVGYKQSNNKKSSKDSNKKSADRSKSHSKSRLLDSSISRSPLTSDIHHESKSHNSRKSLHESNSKSSSKSQRESESKSSSKSRESESNSISKSQRESESNQSSKLRRESGSNSSKKSQRESESNSGSKSQGESEFNQSSKSQCESESNQNSKLQRESESNSSKKSQRESESNQSRKLQCETESKSSNKPQYESESDSGSKSQHESESNQGSKLQCESQSNSSKKSQRESESNQSSKSQCESEAKSSSKSQCESESSQSSKSQREIEPKCSSKSQRESESNISSKSQRESESNSKSQRESLSNHRSNSQHGSESQQSSKSHSKSKSDHSSQSHHDSKSSSHESKSSSNESKSLSRSVLKSNELQQSPSGSLVDKVLKIKESKSQSSFRSEDSLLGKSNENCRKKTTVNVSATAEQVKRTKKAINVFQSDSDDDVSLLDRKEKLMRKEHLVLNEDHKPVCDNSKHGQIVADDLGLRSNDENSKDAGREQQQDAGELKADDTTEEHRDVDDNSSQHNETADIKLASTDVCSASVKNEINDSVAGLTEDPVKQSEPENAKEISILSSDALRELCKSEENSAVVDLEDVNKKPESCSDLIGTDEVGQPSVCQTTRSSDTSDGKDVDHLKSGLSDDAALSKASGLSEPNQSAFDGKDEDFVTMGQDSRGAGDCVTPGERQSSNSDNGLVPSLECASSVPSVEVVTKVSGTEPLTEVAIKAPVCAQSYNLEEVKKDVRLQPFVKLKVLDESVLKKLVSDWEYSVRRKSLASEAAKVVSDLALDNSVPRSQSSSSISSAGKSETMDRCVDKNVPPTGDKEVQEKEKKKRSISSADGVSAAEPPARRPKFESDVKSEPRPKFEGDVKSEPRPKFEGDVKSEPLNIDRKKESSSALPETIAKSLQKAKAEFKRKGGFPSEIVRDDVKKRKTDADKAIPNMENWMHGGREDKKMNSLSFVIPKVKSGQKPDKVKKKKPRELSEEVWLPPPTPAISVPRIPKPMPLPKTLTEEDMGRSVLAKLEDTAGERENLRWQTNDSSYRGKNMVRASDWQPFNSGEDRRGKRFGQEGPHWRNCSPGMPRGGVNESTGSARFQRYNAGSDTGHPRNPSEAPINSSSVKAPRLPPPLQWQAAQQPTRSVTNEKGGSSSSDWVRLYNRDPLRLEDPSAPDECSAAFSPPAVADDESDDIPNGRKSEIPPRKVSTDDGDNMVENVRVLAEAIQEVLVEGTISSGRRDKLVDIYAKLQKNLNLTGGTLQGNASLMNAFYGSADQTIMTVDMFKNLLQHGSTPSQPDSASTLPNLPPATNESTRNDVTLTERDLYFRDSSHVAMGYQDVDHRRMDTRCNPVRGFEKMLLSSTPVSSFSSPRCAGTGKSDVAYGSHPLPIATTGASGSSALHRDRAFLIDPNATFMDIDERKTCSKDVDERGAWARTTAERELATQVTANLNVLRTSSDSIVHKPDSLPQSTTSVDAGRTVLAQERTAENSNTPTVSGSPCKAQPNEIKTLEKTEVPKSKEMLRQEALASRIEDELQLLEMLVTIQCELAEVSPVSEASREAPAADVADPTPVPEQALNTSDNIPSGVSSAVSNSPACAAVRSSVAEEESQGSTTRLSCRVTPQQKADEEQKATASAKEVEDRVISLARNALKPFYHKSQITSEEFKLIMRKAIAKIKVREGEELKESKVTQLINAYVENIIHRRKKVML